jgi:hypothetical protein
MAYRSAAMIAFVFACAGPCWGESYDVYLLGGQSNATGRANALDIGNPALATAQPDVLFYYHKTLSATNNTLPTDQLIDLAPGSGHGITTPVHNTEFGPEVSFGRTLADAFSDQNILVVKYAHGGSNLHSDWAAGGSRYSTFVDTVNTALDHLVAGGDSYRLRGMFWVQGESDAGSVTAANNYEANLVNLIGRVRDDLFDSEAAPFVLSRLSDNQYASLSGSLQTVRAAQANIPNLVANTAYVDTDDDTLFTTRAGDTVHFDANGQINLGVHMGDAMVSLVPEPSTFLLLSLGLLCVFGPRRRR